MVNRKVNMLRLTQHRARHVGAGCQGVSQSDSCHLRISPMDISQASRYFILFLKSSCIVDITKSQFMDEESDGRKFKGLARSHTASHLQRRDLMAVACESKYRTTMQLNGVGCVS